MAAQTTTENVEVIKGPTKIAKGAKSSASVEKPARKTGKATGKKVKKVVKAGRQSVEAKPSKKAAKPKKATAKADGFTDDQKITLITKENPFREGTERHQRFKLFKTGMTVGNYLEKTETLKSRGQKFRAMVKWGHVRVK